MYKQIARFGRNGLETQIYIDGLKYTCIKQSYPFGIPDLHFGLILEYQVFHHMTIDVTFCFLICWNLKLFSLIINLRWRHVKREIT
jgi:hypothetical protein